MYVYASNTRLIAYFTINIALFTNSRRYMNSATILGCRVVAAYKTTTLDDPCEAAGRISDHSDVNNTKFDEY